MAIKTKRGIFMSYFYDGNETELTREQLIKKVKRLELELKMNDLENRIKICINACWGVACSEAGINIHYILSQILSETSWDETKRKQLLTLGAILLLGNIALVVYTRKHMKEKDSLEEQAKSLDDLTIGYTDVTFVDDGDYEIRTESTKTPKNLKNRSRN